MKKSVKITLDCRSSSYASGRSRILVYAAHGLTGNYQQDGTWFSPQLCSKPVPRLYGLAVDSFHY